MAAAWCSLAQCQVLPLMTLRSHLCLEIISVWLVSTQRLMVSHPRLKYNLGKDGDGAVLGRKPPVLSPPSPLAVIQTSTISAKEFCASVYLATVRCPELIQLSALSPSI